MTDKLVVPLDEIPQIAVDKIYQNFRVALPAEALAYNRDTSRTQAAPQVRFMLTNRKLMIDPVIPGVPVIHYAGGGYGCWFDLADGDPGVILCCDGPVTGYYDTGEPTVPGGASGSHTLGSSVFSPGGRISSPQQPTPPPNATGEFLIGAGDGTAAVILRRAGGPTPAELGTVVVASSGPTASVLLGGVQAADPVACATEVLANLQSLATTIAAIPTTDNPIADQAVAAIKVAVASWFAGLQPMGDLKARVEGPVPLPP